ncbi:efflux RND transporter periplasmic adaptor subunit [Ferriphaselus sp. R-1]|uniref:efflux RND transporter periplasmic adaptor subunit n=1 Tax=Ferriphaselus sp. R-1 TaxID=1485544 RepID=UPI00068FF4C7|nr:efflux RND transporter periplasmic adaptor subunit [Ferriphaselus sp. R-1]
MKPANLILLLAVAALTGAAGYHWGKQHAEPQVAASSAPPAVRKVLYYRNPMGLPDTSPVPKVDSMGMDYVPVYADEAVTPGTVVLSPAQVQKLGVVTEAVARRALSGSLRSTAVIQPDERSQRLVAPRFGGWVRQLHASATGQPVRRGQPLLEVYSPELESALREYQLAQASGLTELAQSTRQRLRNWELGDEDLAHLAHGMATLQLRAPADGVVLEKAAVQGARFAPGDVLFRIADLSRVWVQAQVAEQDQGVLRVGQSARVTLDAYPGETYSGKVGFIAPVLDPQTRTVQVRVELPNPQGRLRPAMYAQVEFATGHAAPVLTIPLSAVLDSGVRQLALVQVAQGRFEPRALRLGRRDGDYVEVLEGVGEGEQVVTQANFLLDAESSLRAALGNTTFSPREGDAGGLPTAAQLPIRSPMNGGGELVQQVETGAQQYSPLPQAGEGVGERGTAQQHSTPTAPAAVRHVHAEHQHAH